MDTSIDLIYGAPGESLDSWKQTVENALSLGSGHISAYSLIVEPGTKLARQIRSGELAQTDEDLDAEKYVFADRAFTDAGLDWYEFSNWGKPSAHNQAYWRSQNWWGYGPGAHSHLSGNRFWNVKHPLTYQNRVTESTAVAGLEYIDKRTHLEERLMLDLRTSAGIPMETISELEINPELLASSQDNGELMVIDGNLVVTDKGRLFVDRIVLQLLTN
jgi:oxygen-independent coproporphyrinogen-3 oxidase